MVAWALTVISGIAGLFAGRGATSGGGSGDASSNAIIELGTSKISKKDQYTTTTSTQSTYAPVTTTTRTSSNIYSYAPQYIIDSPYASQTSKKDIASSQPVETTPSVSPALTPTIMPTLDSGGSGGGSIDWFTIALLGGGGFLLYKYITKGK